MKNLCSTWLAPTIISVGTFLSFLPMLWNEFVNFDDINDLVNNPHYRGLGWNQLAWMFSIQNAHYYPLTWMSHGLDYLIWGLDPVGYHLTNLILHTANAVMVFFIARRLIALSIPNASWLTLGAMFAALLKHQPAFNLRSNYDSQHAAERAGKGKHEWKSR